MKIWFTSDTHFRSERTLQLSKRPFNSVEEMDQTMINNWNKVVSEHDIVFHLGDFGNYEVSKRLNGNIILIFGNLILIKFFQMEFPFVMMKKELI